MFHYFVERNCEKLFVVLQSVGQVIAFPIAESIELDN